MKSTLLLFILLLALLGAFTLDSFVFHVVYLIAGAYLIGHWWSNRSLSALSFNREFASHAFPGEIIPVRLKINNPGRLPIPWIYLQESLPLEISNVKTIREVLTLPPKGQYTLDYQLYPRKRGYFALGPVHLSSGDMLGLSAEVQRSIGVGYLTVYPKVISLQKIAIPSRSPLGTLRHQQPIFEDPTRPIGKRNYSPGDSQRRIDWKSSAVSGSLQVKLYEPSIALETMIFLDLNTEDYHIKIRFDASELAIIIASSLANWITDQKQAVGLLSNGLDSLTQEVSHPVPARKGRANLIHILESLARIELNHGPSIAQLVREHRHRLSWGTTMIVITSHCERTLINEFVQARKSGINIMLVLAGHVPGAQEIKREVEILGIPFALIHDEQDLLAWRR